MTIHPPSVPGARRRRGRYRALAGASALAVVALTAWSVLAPDGGTTPTAQAEGSAAATGGDRPNVVVVMADDLDARVPFWDAMPQTAALLRDRGLEFEQAFSPDPTCCPARASLYTGDLAHNTGVLENGSIGDPETVSGFETFVANGYEDDTVFRYLQDAGYATGFVGKWMNDAPADYVPPDLDTYIGTTDSNAFSGYEYTLNENGTLVGYGSAEEDYVTDVLAAKSREFVHDSAAAGEPFYLLAGPTPPHAPMPPAPRHADHEYAEATLPRSENFNEADVSDKPQWLQEQAEQRSAAVEATVDEDYQDRMGSLYALDDMVAGLVEEVRAAGELDSTYFVFTSDNGYNWGSHTLLQKFAAYEESIRVPLVVAGPGVATGTTDSLALMPDLAPTVLDLAGIEVPDLDTRSLVPLLDGTAPPDWRTDFLAEYGSDDYDTDLPDLIDVPKWRAVRTATHIYIETYADEADQGRVTDVELYNLRRDPYQLENLLAPGVAVSTTTQELVTELDARLAELETCSGTACH
ncbi:MAG: sulfatase [Kineosporiaceae bacterium]